MRLMRPLLVVRFLTALLGVAVCLPAASADAATRKSSAAHRTSTAKKKPAYSAAASNSRKSRLAHARAAVRAREQARLRSLQALQEAMTPRYKTDATGAAYTGASLSGPFGPYMQTVPTNPLAAGQAWQSTVTDGTVATKAPRKPHGAATRGAEGTMVCLGASNQCGGHQTGATAASSGSISSATRMTCSTPSEVAARLHRWPLV